ncbi:ABC transporter permease [Paenibacillus sanguinis]|uniref:ABC transporter permease n=1 Tax=Paenibacillus sanguinis TaxID=225906 RepID=UPI0003822562|nr:ABC transporter permease [Paenibacillus sanguinis]
MSRQNLMMIKKLSKANLKADNVKLYFAGSIIALAAVLLTVVFTFGYNSFTNMQQDSDFQAIFNDVSEAKSIQLEQVNEVDKVGLYLEVGREKQEERLLSILYTDQTMMDLSYARIDEGKFPTKPNEIVIERDYFSKTSYKPGIGDRIVVEFRNNASKQMQMNEFVISGLLHTTASGEGNRISYNALVSKAFVDADPHLSKEKYSAAIRILNAGSYANEELKSTIKDIGKQIDLSEQNIQINHKNVDTHNLSSDTILTIFCILFIIALACWVVIYNIFYISIIKQIKQYGQLRALGATRKQIKKLVKYEGRYLSRKFIPAGVLLGCLISWAMNPFTWNLLPSIFLALAAGLFTELTVRFSLNSPANFAAKISPIEAIRYVGAETYTFKKKEKKSSKRLTPFTLAGMSLTRSRKKTTLTLLSLVISGVLFISFATLLSSVDSIAKTRHYFPNNGKFIIQVNNELYSETVNLSDLQSEDQLSGALKDDILSISGVENVVDRQYIEARVNGTEESEGPMVVGIEDISASNIESLRKRLVQGDIPEPNSSNNFQILMNSSSGDFEFYDIRYQVGDRVSLIIGDDKNKIEHEFEIVGDLADKNLGVLFYLPSGVMESITPFNPNQSYEVILTQDTNEQMVKDELEKIIQNEDTLKLNSFSDMAKSNKAAFRTITIAVYTFMIFIALFSVINLLNTVMTSINARKFELGIMQAIGMEYKQLSAMLGYEAGFFIVGSFVISLIIGNLIGYGLSESLGNVGGLSFIQYHFPWSPILMYLIVMLLIRAVVLKIVRISTAQKTVVERLR